MAINLDKAMLVDLQSLTPPPHPWGKLASLGTLYFLGDVNLLGLSAVKQFLASHPLILAKVGRTRHVVVGQFRAWEILQTYALKYPDYFRSAYCIVKSMPEDALQDVIAENLFLEGLIFSLSPEFAAAQMSNLWLEIPESIRKHVLPSINTQAEFSSLLAYRSRTIFDRKQQKRLKDQQILKAGRQPTLISEDDGSTTS